MSAEATPAQKIVAQGRLEPAGGVIGIFGTMGDRVDFWNEAVREGNLVEMDTELGEFASHRAAELEQRAVEVKYAEYQRMAEAEKRAKQADLETAAMAAKQVDAALSELPAKETEVAILKNAFELAKEQRDKVIRLFETTNLISESKREQVRLTAEQAKAKWEAAEIQLESLRIKADAEKAAAAAKTESVAAGHDRALATIPLKSAAQQLEVLKEKLHNGSIPAPITGTILKVYIRPGETIARGPLLQMADLDHMICIAEVYESYIKDIKPGQKATIRSAVFNQLEEVHGRVESVGRIILAPEMKKLDPFAKSDVRIVEVRIAIDPGADTQQASKLVNLQVDVEIEAGTETPDTNE